MIFLKNFLIKSFKKNFIFISIVIVFLNLSNFFYNTHSILNRPYEERMIRSYGYCEREAYGFIKDSYNILNNNKLNLKVINFENTKWPNIGILFQKIKKDYNKNYLILLNVKEINKLDNNIYQVSYNKEKIYYKEENIILNYANCYLIKNND